MPTFYGFMLSRYNGLCSKKLAAKNLDDARKEIDRSGERWEEQATSDLEKDFTSLHWRGEHGKSPNDDLQKLGLRQVFVPDEPYTWEIWELPDSPTKG